MRETFLTENEFNAIKSGKEKLNFEHFAERSFNEYTQQFGLDEHALQGKKILDVGPSFKFQEEAKEKGIDVVGVDPSKRIVPEGAQFVEGSAQFLPFEDESFDVVLANTSVPVHIDRNDNEGALLSIYQMLRVAKDEVRMTPFTPSEVFEKDGKIILSDPDVNPDNQFSEFNLKDLLNQCGIQYHIGNHEQIERWKKKDYSGNPDWSASSDYYYISLSKTEDTNLEPIEEEIKRLINLHQK